jgi:hypothetical protein
MIEGLVEAVFNSRVPFAMPFSEKFKIVSAFLEVFSNNQTVKHSIIIIVNLLNSSRAAKITRKMLKAILGLASRCCRTEQFHRLVHLISVDLILPAIASLETFASISHCFLLDLIKLIVNSVLMVLLSIETLTFISRVLPSDFDFDLLKINCPAAEKWNWNKKV